MHLKVTNRQNTRLGGPTGCLPARPIVRTCLGTFAAIALVIPTSSTRFNEPAILFRHIRLTKVSLFDRAVSADVIFPAIVFARSLAEFPASSLAFVMA